MPTVLAILAEGFEEIEAIAPVDLLRRAGAEVTVAALGADIHVVGRDRIVVHADTTLASIGDQVFDCLFLPGGPGTRLLRSEPSVRATVLRHHEARKWVTAICAAPAVLHDAGILAGRRYTAHPSVEVELPHVLAGERVVVDGQLITSRGAGTAVEFGLALVEHLFSPAKAEEIARAICR